MARGSDDTETAARRVSDGRADRRAAGLVTLLVFLFVLLRGVAQITDLGGFDEEQAVNGTLTKDLIDGLVLPIHSYQYRPFAHGPLILGFVLYPFYLVLGKYYAVIPLVGFLISVGSLLLWLAVVRRGFGPAARVPFAVLFLACPPLVLFVSRHVWANHYESWLFVAWTFLALDRAARSRRGIDAALLGLVCGLGTLFCFQGLVAAVVAGVVLAAVRPLRRAPARLALQTAGAFVGFSPALIYYWINPRGVAILLRGSSRLETFSSVGAKAWGFVTGILPVLPEFQGRVHNAIYLAAMGAAWLPLVVFEARRLGARDDRQPPTSESFVPIRRALVLYPLVWFCAYLTGRYPDPVSTVSPYTMRYTVILFPCFFAAVAGLGAPRRRWLGWAAAALMAAVVLADGGLRGSIRAGVDMASSPDRLCVLRQFKGYDYATALRRLVMTDLRADAPLPLTPELRSFEQEVRGALYARTNERPFSVEWLGDSPTGDEFFVAARVARRMEDLCSRNALAVGTAGVASLSGRAPAAFWIGVGQGFAAMMVLLEVEVPISPGGNLDPSGSRADYDSLEFPRFLSRVALLLPRLSPDEQAGVARGLGEKGSILTMADLPARLSAMGAGGALPRDALLEGIGRGIAARTILRANYVRSEDAAAPELAKPIVRSDRDWPVVRRGFEEEIARRGYRLTPVPGMEWMRLDFIEKPAL